MYTEFYNLKGQPFQLTPDHRFLYYSQPHQGLIAEIVDGLDRGDQLTVITGEVGAGKTTLINFLLSEIKDRHLIAAKLVTTHLEAESLLRLIATAFGVRGEASDGTSVFANIEAFLVESRKAGKKPLLVIDEVQNLASSSFEQLHALSKIQASGKPVLQILLVGQPQFRGILASERLAQIRQSIDASHHVQPLSAEDTRKYIEHRLKYVGWRDDPSFPEEAFQTIFEATGGVPRVVNLLCDRLLLFGFLEQRHRFEAADVENVVNELGEEGSLPVLARPIQPLPPPYAADASGHLGAPDLQAIVRRVSNLRNELESEEAKLKAALARSSTTTGESSDGAGTRNRTSAGSALPDVSAEIERLARRKGNGVVHYVERGVEPSTGKAPSAEAFLDSVKDQNTPTVEQQAEKRHGIADDRRDSGQDGAQTDESFRRLRGSRRHLGLAFPSAVRLGAGAFVILLAVAGAMALLPVPGGSDRAWHSIVEWVDGLFAPSADPEPAPQMDSAQQQAVTSPQAEPPTQVDSIAPRDAGRSPGDMPAEVTARSVTPPAEDLPDASGRLVLRIQYRLAALGFDPGPLDGTMGSQTSQAITAYQRAHGLKADGIPTGALLGHIERERLSKRSHAVSDRR